MKTKEELNAINEEVEAPNKKLHELTDEELTQATGGTVENDGEKAKIKGLESDIESELNIIHYEGKVQ